MVLECFAGYMLARPSLYLTAVCTQAPLCEEWVFRACMAALLRVRGYSMATTVLVTPLFFGAAHMHHVYNLVRHQGFPLTQALLAVSFSWVHCLSARRVCMYLWANH